MNPKVIRMLVLAAIGVALGLVAVVTGLLPVSPIVAGGVGALLGVAVALVMGRKQ